MHCCNVSGLDRFHQCYYVQVDQMRGTLTVNNPNGTSGEPPKTFTFDIVYGSDCKQLDVYNEIARPVVDCVLEGYNGWFNSLLHMHKMLNVPKSCSMHICMVETIIWCEIVCPPKGGNPNILQELFCHEFSIQQYLF